MCPQLWLRSLRAVSGLWGSQGTIRTVRHKHIITIEHVSNRQYCFAIIDWLAG